MALDVIRDTDGLPVTLLDMYLESEEVLNSGSDEFIPLYQKMFDKGFELYKDNALTVKNYDQTDRPATLSANDIFFPFYAGVRLASYYAERDIEKSIEIRKELMEYTDDACKHMGNVLMNHIFLKFLYYTSPFCGDEMVNLKGEGFAAKMMWLLYFNNYDAMADYYLTIGDAKASYDYRYKQIVQGCACANDTVRYIMFLPGQMLKLLLVCKDEAAVKKAVIPLMRLFYAKKNDKHMNSNISEVGQLIDSFLELKNYPGLENGTDAMIEYLKVEAEKRNGFANCAMGLLCEKGLIVKKNPSLADRYYLTSENVMEYAANKVELSDSLDPEAKRQAEDIRTELRIRGEIKYADNPRYFDEKFGA